MADRKKNPGARGGASGAGKPVQSAADQARHIQDTASSARKRDGREYLSEIPVFDLATRYSSEIAETPFIQKALRPAARPLLLVGKKSPRPLRNERRKDRERLMRFKEAVAFAYDMDWPLNFGITVTWTALRSTGEQNEGHCLWRDEWDREKYTRNELARLCRSEGLPFVALWGRDVGAKLGLHNHISLFWPHYKLARLVNLAERISGSSADFMLRPYTADVVARSVCGGWQINMNTRKDGKQGALDWAEYIAAQHAKHPAASKIIGKAFGISQAIGKAAQERARPALEARAVKYWAPPNRSGRKPLRGPNITPERQ